MSKLSGLKEEAVTAMEGMAVAAVCTLTAGAIGGAVVGGGYMLAEAIIPSSTQNAPKDTHAALRQENKVDTTRTYQVKPNEIPSLGLSLK